MKSKKLRPVLRDFAILMETKLKENDYKGGWEGENIGRLQGLLDDERNELEQALCHMTAAMYCDGMDPEFQKALEECADVANFAMMLADRVGYLKRRYEANK